MREHSETNHDIALYLDSILGSDEFIHDLLRKMAEPGDKPVLSE